MQRIFVGDVQGCADELDELLGRVRQRFGDEFELWLVGDLVNRGPSSLRVLATVRELADAGRARVVLGNHEVSLLEVALGIRGPAPNDSFLDVLDAPDVGDWIDWIRGWPLVALGRLGETSFAMVHAAVPTDWGLDQLADRARRAERRLAGSRAEAARLLAADPQRDPECDLVALVTSCRAVAADGTWSPDPPADPEDVWHRRWAARGHRYGVVYGHWSLQGLHVAPGLRGLDTGCVHHGRGREGFLTAWLPKPGDANPFAVPDDRFWSVRAHRRYWPFGAGRSGESPLDPSRGRE